MVLGSDGGKYDFGAVLKLPNRWHGAAIRTLIRVGSCVKLDILMFVEVERVGIGGKTNTEEIWSVDDVCDGLPATSRAARLYACVGSLDCMEN